ncbi:MAG: hypothetical protein OHK0032_03370 [Thermodesulfovibrionales bacterium]
MQNADCKMQIAKLTVYILTFLFFIFHFSPDTCYASEDLYAARLDKGLSNTEPYSYLLIKMAHEDRGRAKTLLVSARKYSPDLPAVYFGLARESFSLSPLGIFETLEHLRQGIKAYGRNFWWEFSIAGLIYSGLLVSFFFSMLIVLLIRFPMEAGLLLHDGMEDRKRLILFGLLPFLSLFGLISFIAGAFSLIGFYFKRTDRIVVYASLLFFILSPMLQGIAGIFFTTPPPTLKAVVAVNEGRDNRYALWTLKGRDDLASAFSYALALKREGYYNEAIDVYKGLASRTATAPKNLTVFWGPRVYLNLGNSYYAVKDIEAAKESYKKSIEIAALPSAFYNLSQIHREMLDFVKGDEYFLEAAKLNPEAVHRFTSISGPNPNRFVVDETLPMSALWGYAIDRTPHPLTKNLFLSGIAVILTAMFFTLNRKIRHRAHKCKRCGAIFCSKCSRAITWGEMCPDCFRSFIKMEGLEPKERIAKLLSVYQSQVKRRKTARLLSCVIPGAGQVYSGRMLSGLLFLWVFLFSITLLVMNQFPFTGLSSFSHDWLVPFIVILMALTYMLSIVHMRRGIQKGWL